MASKKQPFRYFEKLIQIGLEIVLQAIITLIMLASLSVVEKLFYIFWSGQPVLFRGLTMEMPISWLIDTAKIGLILAFAFSLISMSIRYASNRPIDKSELSGRDE